jgi:hypothetical protein
MTFEEWYNEIEGYGTRGERFEDWMFSTGDADKGKDWLLAAYNAGVKQGQSTLSGVTHGAVGSTRVYGSHEGVGMGDIK